MEWTVGRVNTLVTYYSLVAAIEADFDPSTLHAEKRRLLQKNAGPAIGFMPDDGSGQASVLEEIKLVHMQILHISWVAYFSGINFPYRLRFGE